VIMKSTFIDIGNVTVHDTDAKGAKRRDKNAKEWSGGSGIITLPGGAIHKVFVSVRKGSRPGTTNVGLSLIVEPTETTTPNVPQ